MRHWLLFAVAACLAGCGSSQIKDPKATAEKALADARSAHEKKDVKKAQAAAKEAERAAEAAQNDTTLHPEVKMIAVETRDWAELTREEAEVEDRVNSLKARAYRTSRDAGLKIIFGGMALAANQAAEKGIDGLPQQAQSLANEAAELAQKLVNRKPLPDGRPDWKGIASDMRVLSDGGGYTGPILAGCLALSGQSELALVEAYSVPLPQAPGEERQMALFARGAVLAMNGHDQMSRRAIEESEVYERSNPNSKELTTFIHLLAAYVKGKEQGDWLAADKELSHVAQLWPNNVLTVALTGERLAANGEVEKAADSFETMAEKTEYKAVAKCVAERARAIRDRKVQAQPLILDGSFLVELGFIMLSQMADQSAWAKKVDATVSGAKTVTKKLLDKLPGGSAAPEKSP